MPFCFRRLRAITALIILVLLAPAATSHAGNTASAPTHRIFATREGLVGHRTANGHIIQPRDRFVALPFRGALSRNGGHEFQVRVTYRDRSVVLPVWDIGPWNISDDYWSPNRRYADVPVGTPMAQAAYQRGYNGGRDDSGRRIGAPNGIDIADGAFWDDLGMRGSDWVQVSFLWMGADSGSAAKLVAEPVTRTTIDQHAIVVDNNGDDRFWTTNGLWSDGPCGLNDHAALARSTQDVASSQRAGWNVQVPAPGRYEVFVNIPLCGEQTTKAAHYRITNGDSIQDVTVNQQKQADHWVSLGTYSIEHDASVELSNVTEDSGKTVLFDAVQWVPRP